MKTRSILIACTLFTSLAYTQSDSITVSNYEYEKYADSIEKTLTYQYGKIVLKNGVATINVPEGYKFLGPEQSKYVLTDLWGNPPNDVLGMLFPEEITPLSEHFTYAIEITYSEEGYIKDNDVEEIDYDELLTEMQKDAREVNPERINQGYEPIELVGWASEPYYDKGNKKLHWAKELRFGDAEINTLNYNIRILGRKGYLNLNAIGDIDILPVFKNNIDDVLESAEFSKGYKYSEFNPDIDEVAAYGIGGLIAGKILAKAGFFALLLKFWKIIAVAAIGVFGLLRKRIFRSRE